jgi:hypothetical protein
MITSTYIPVSNDVAFSFSITLENILCNLSFFWNYRTEHYHFTVKLQDGTSVIEGMKCISMYPMKTSTMFANGLTGVFYMTPASETIEDNAETRKNIAENFVFSYVA